jgi:hypothetical protein
MSAITPDTNNSDAQLDASLQPSADLAESIRHSKAMSERGHDGDQNSLSFSRGQEVEAARNTPAKPVDRRTITGSYPGDSRLNKGDTAKASLNQAADNGGPRARMGQFVDNKKITNNLPAENWSGDADTRN